MARRYVGGGQASLSASFGGWEIDHEHSPEHVAASDHRRSRLLDDPPWKELQRSMGMRKLPRLLRNEAGQRVPTLELAFGDHLLVDFLGIRQRTSVQHRLQRQRLQKRENIELGQPGIQGG